MTDPTAVRPVPAALAVVARGDQVLLVQRGKAPDLGRWGFPGGRIEPGEGHLTAAARELAEETGVIAEPGAVLAVLDIIGVVPEPSPPTGAGVESPGLSAATRTLAADDAGSAALTHHFILIAVACRWIAGEPVAADDAADARWFDLAAIEDPSLPKSRDVLWLARRALGLPAEPPAEL